MIRLIATDLDGTLLEPDGTLPEGIFPMIRKLAGMGIQFAACSGRQYGNLRRLFAPSAEQMAFVCENGALSVFDGKPASVFPISPKDAREVIADIERLGMNLLISGQHTCYMLDRNRAYTDDIVYRLRNTVTMVRSVDDIAEPMLKISGQIDSGVAAFVPELSAKWQNRLTATAASFDWFDFTVANKGMGIRGLMEHMGVRPEETVAFGDNFNDETMLEAVGHPFLMQQAPAALRKPGVRMCSKVLPILQRIADAQGDPEKAFAGLKIF